MSRECGDCNLCCTGYLSGEVDRKPFGDLVPCSKLHGGCTIYETRPMMCSEYQCAWLQGIFPDWMRPDKVNTVVSVERKHGVQFLRAVSPFPITTEVKAELNTFTTQHDSHWVNTIVLKQVQ